MLRKDFLLVKKTSHFLLQAQSLHHYQLQQLGNKYKINLDQSQMNENFKDYPKEQTKMNQISKEFQFIQSLLSWPNIVQAPLSQNHQLLHKTSQLEPTIQQLELTQNKQQEFQTLKHRKLSALKILTFNHQICTPSQLQKKDWIKTFPNFIFRTFKKYFTKYEHLYSEEDGVQKIKKYLADQKNAKHYTLQQLSYLFEGSSQWNVRLNRIMLQRMLSCYGYRSVFGNSQRKKKKDYLVMTKVFKLRCRNSTLSSRVQSQ